MTMGGGIESGSDAKKTRETNTDKSSSTRKTKLNIDEEGIQKIIDDMLSGNDGLAAIFGGEQTAGIFDSSVAAQAAGDLASKIAGELAKITAEQVISEESVGGSQRVEKERSDNIATNFSGSF
jgi:hypothetical protein